MFNTYCIDKNCKKLRMITNDNNVIVKEKKKDTNDTHKLNPYGKANKIHTHKDVPALIVMTQQSH